MFNVNVKRYRHNGGIERIMKAFDGPKAVKVGFPAGTGSDLVMRAVWNEFGTKGSGKGFSTPRGGGFGGPIPERPFMRNAMRENRAGLQSVMGKGAHQVLRGEVSLNAMLARLGIYLQGKIQGEITSLASPPNSPTTIRLKGSSNPLIDSGEMRQRVTWKVD